MKFRDWVKFLKTRRGMNTAAICAELGLASASTLSSLARGRALPSAQLQLRVCRVSRGRVRSILDFLSPAQEEAFQRNEPRGMPKKALSQQKASDETTWNMLTPEEKAALRYGPSEHS